METIKSPGIDRAVQITIGAGNSIKEISDGWSNFQQVVYMANGLTAVYLYGGAFGTSFADSCITF